MLKPALYTFLKVCETGSFTKAASRLYITPSAVIQQMNSLEAELKTALFIRNPKGISLTQAGTCLLEQGKDLVQKNKDLRRKLAAISAIGNELCVGTSMLEKCRLLYDLWILFSEHEKNYEIKMVTIDQDHAVPDRADLVESVNGHMPWARDFRFLEICQVPFGFAFSKDHPLAEKEIITPEDLRGEAIYSLNTGSSAEISSMLQELRDAGALLNFQIGAVTSNLWEISFQKKVLVVPICWEDILLHMTVRPCTWNHTIPYGIFYRPNPSPAASKFLDFIREAYRGTDPKKTMWVMK